MSESDDAFVGILEDSESESKTLGTGCRNTETTVNFNQTRADELYELGNAMSLHVNVETKFGSTCNPSNPSIVSHNIKSLRRKKRQGLGQSSCKPC
jgi:hypothetical protein